MTLAERKFCEAFESELNWLMLLHLIIDDLTDDGRKELTKVDRYINENSEKYLEINDRIKLSSSR